MAIGFRRVSQLSSTILSNSYLASTVTRNINTNGLKGVCVPFLNCYSCPGALFSCPVGAIQHFMAIHVFPFYLLAFIGLVGITVGRMPCGWLCPFGFLQEVMYTINSPKFKIPYALTYIKYLILIILVVMLPYVTGESWFSKICPAGALTAGLPWVIWNPTNLVTGRPLLPAGPGALFYLSLILLLFFLAWCVVSKRPFCRVACPLGGMLSLFSRISLIRLEAHRCDGCNTCESNCPMDLNIYLDPNAKECIRCLDCTQCGYVKVITPFTTPEGTWAGRKES